VGAWGCSTFEVDGVLQIFLFFLTSYFSLLLVVVVLFELVFPPKVISCAMDRVS